MTRYSKSDLFRYVGDTGRNEFMNTWRNNPGYRFIFFFRWAQAKRKRSLTGYIARKCLKACSYKFGIQIPLDTVIGEGFYIGHFGTIVINGKVRIGRNFNISQGVTIGQANRGKYKGEPEIGDSVWIGPNAIVVGKIRIGNDVLIAPGAFVNFDVPDHSMVVGNPGVIKSREHATEGYINRTV